MARLEPPFRFQTPSHQAHGARHRKCTALRHLPPRFHPTRRHRRPGRSEPWAASRPSRPTGPDRPWTGLGTICSRSSTRRDGGRGSWRRTSAWTPRIACWARQTVVALTIVLTHRPVRPLPFTLEELEGPEPWSPPAPRSLADRVLLALDRFLHVYHHRPIGFIRRWALSRAERWVVDRQ